MKQTTLAFGKSSSSNKKAPSLSVNKNKLKDEDGFSKPSKIKKSSKTTTSSKKQPLEQLVLDCGQKSLKSNRCNQCGMVYMNGDFQDEKVHSQFCKSYKKLMKYKITSKDFVKEDEDTYKIVVINSLSPKPAQKKAEQIVQFIDENCLNCTLPFNIAVHTIFLYVNSDTDDIVGCVVAERIEKAHPSFVEKREGYDNTLDESFVSDEHLMSTASIDSAMEDKKSIFSWDHTIVKAAVCGINRIWVNREQRRHGVASILIDAVRKHYIFGCELEKSQVAFTPTTPKGAYFAKRYFEGTFKDADFLVYVTLDRSLCL